MNKPCNTCPFLKNTINIGSEEWMKDVFALVQLGLAGVHTCHKTDANADGYVAGEKRPCGGIKLLAINSNIGFHLHKDIFKDWLSFFKHHRRGQEYFNGALK